MTPYAEQTIPSHPRMGGINVPFKLQKPGPIAVSSDSGKPSEQQPLPLAEPGPAAVTWAPTHKAPFAE